jgi:hypothetical protein
MWRGEASQVWQRHELILQVTTVVVTVTQIASAGPAAGTSGAVIKAVALSSSAAPASAASATATSPQPSATSDDSDDSDDEDLVGWVLRAVLVIADRCSLTAMTRTLMA